MVLACVVARRHQYQPLNTQDHLHQHTEQEQKNLIEECKVDTNVEGDDEDLLDHDGCIDENIGGAHPCPDHQAGGHALLCTQHKPQQGTCQHSQKSGQREQEVPPAECGAWGVDSLDDDDGQDD